MAKEKYTLVPIYKKYECYFCTHYRSIPEDYVLENYCFTKKCNDKVDGLHCAFKKRKEDLRRKPNRKPKSLLRKKLENDAERNMPYPF